LISWSKITLGRLDWGRLDAPAIGGGSVPSICAMRDGVDRVGELAFNALSNALFNTSTLWWSSVAELVGVATVGVK